VFQLLEVQLSGWLVLVFRFVLLVVLVVRELGECSEWTLVAFFGGCSEEMRLGDSGIFLRV